MDITGAQLITRFLERQGVALVPGIPGGALLPLYRALADSTLTHILARHEQGAAFIAHGLARVTGRAGVVLATSGPGVTNVVTALADAKMDSVPLVCIAGQVPRKMIGTDAFQEVAAVPMARPLTKAAFHVGSAAEPTRPVSSSQSRLRRVSSASEGRGLSGGQAISQAMPCTGRRRRLGEEV